MKRTALRFETGPMAATLVAMLFLLSGCATNRNDAPVTTSKPQNTSSTRAPVPAAGNKSVKRAPAASSVIGNPKSACKVRSDSVAWEYRAGPCRNGFLHGEGEAASADGQRQYRGGFADGVFHGQGSYDWGNGVRYEGAFVRGTKSGRGTIVYADNRKFTGDFQNNLYHGKGVYTDADGSVYEGEFRHGRFNGRGIYTWVNGDNYTGQFKDDLMEGEGVYQRANGEKYSGPFRKNERDGIGHYTWPNGDRYEGAFRSNEMNGEGTYTYADGSRYIGAFADGKKHGPGRLVSGGAEYRQQWERGEKTAEEPLPSLVENAKAPIAPDRR